MTLCRSYQKFIIGCLTFLATLPVRDGLAQEGVEPDGDSVYNAEASEGGWGRLEYFPVYLEPSESFFDQSRYAFLDDSGTVWKFLAEDGDRVRETLLDAGIDKATSDFLLSSKCFQAGSYPGTFEIRPTEEIVLGLTGEQRAKLYPRMFPKSEDNPYFRPIELPVGGFSAISAVPTGISPALEQQMEQLCYARDRSKVFSDLGFLQKRAANKAEKMRILKTLLRERTFQVRLRIPRGDEFFRAAMFWTANGRNGGAGDILESAARNPSISHIDLIHLLPPTPKKLLHTYPSKEGYVIRDAVPDCYWTALSFFTDEPPERYLDEIGPLFEQRFEPVSGFLLFGDLIVIRRRSDGKPVHACNYLAGNLVFTKNGLSAARPWVISTIKDITESYLAMGPVQVSYFRLKSEYRF